MAANAAIVSLRRASNFNDFIPVLLRDRCLGRIHSENISRS